MQKAKLHLTPTITKLKDRQASKQDHTDTKIAYSFNLTLQPTPPQQVEHQSRISLTDSSLVMQAFHPSYHSSRTPQSASHQTQPTQENVEYQTPHMDVHLLTPQTTSWTS